jgi:hypothetical protein
VSTLVPFDSLQVTWAFTRSNVATSIGPNEFFDFFVIRRQAGSKVPTGLPPVPVAPMRPIVMAREEVMRSPVLICVGEAPWVQSLLIDRLFVDPRLNVHPLLAINGRGLMVIMMMLDELTMDHWRRDVGFLDDLAFYDRWPQVSFPFWIRPKVCS